MLPDSELIIEMRRRWPKLTRDQLDQAESLYNNLEVIVDRIFEESSDGRIVDDHCPGLDIHINEIARGLLSVMAELSILGAPPGQMGRFVFDTLDGVFKFGYEVGRLGWPIPKLKCEEVHEL